MMLMGGAVMTKLLFEKCAKKCWSFGLTLSQVLFPIWSAYSNIITSLVPGAEEERLVHTDALPVN